MNILEMNRIAWDKIGKKHGSLYYQKKNIIIDLFLKKLPKRGKILDVGCGSGLPVSKLLVKKGFDIVCIDISGTMIHLAKKNVQKAKFIKMSMTDIKFRNEFDGIISSFSMLCLNKRLFNKTSYRITKALKHGGYFLIILNETPPQGHNEKASYIKILGQKLYSRPYDESYIRNIFEKLGMKIIKIERKIISSKKYGKEYTLSVLMKKIK